MVDEAIVLAQPTLALFSRETFTPALKADAASEDCAGCGSIETQK